MGRGLSELQKHMLTVAYQNHIGESLPPPRHVVHVIVGAHEHRQPIKTRLLQTKHPLLWRECETWATYARKAQKWYREGRTDVDPYQKSYATVCFSMYDYNADGSHVLYWHPHGYNGAFEIPVGLLDSYEDASILTTYLKSIDFQTCLTWEYPILGPDRRWSIGGHFYNYEVLWTWFDFARASIRPYRDNAGKRNPYFHHFDPKVIGLSAYNAAKVAVSRAIHRLADRHLVFDFPTGFHLTPEGVKLTKELIG